MRSAAPGPLTLGALWFAASVSLAEIATGGLMAGSGLLTGTLASIAGHLMGAVFFFGAGWISWKRGKRAIAVCEDAFGERGPVLFGALNFIQLVGWTAVMIVVGAGSMDQVLGASFGFGGETLWRAALGAFILVWAVLGPGVIGKANAAAAAALLALCVPLSVAVFEPFVSGRAPALPAAGGAFGTGFELAVIMPLSWLPLVGDYVVGAAKGRRAIIASSASYAVGSLWMYAIGLGGVIVLGSSDPVSLLGKAWTIPALAIVLLSTVTTAFLDARSAGISLNAALPKVDERTAVFLAAALGMALAFIAPVERYEGFLFLIGSVFAPLYAVLFADYSLRRGAEATTKGRIPAAFICWAIGVVAYHLFNAHSSILGTTIPVMALVACLYSLYVIGVRKCA